jgi:predicted XRE-type DNA-binding protein
MAKAAPPRRDQAAHAEDPNFNVSSGNVYADLGFDDPEHELAKARLALQIGRLARERGPIESIGESFGLSPSDLLSIARGDLADFSIDRLMDVLTHFDQEVEIVVRPVEPGMGKLIATIAD